MKVIIFSSCFPVSVSLMLAVKRISVELGDLVVVVGDSILLDTDSTIPEGQLALLLTLKTNGVATMVHLNDGGIR